MIESYHKKDGLLSRLKEQATAIKQVLFAVSVLRCFLDGL